MGMMLRGESLEGVVPSWKDMTGVFGKEMPQRLIDVMGAVCAQCPVEHCCNTPDCTSTATLSELRLASSKGTRCSSCKASRSCCPDCQKRHWKLHRPVCKRIREAAAAVAAQQLSTGAA